LFRPNSIVSLILIGFAVVLTPLIAAVVTAVVYVDRLAQDSREAVLEAQSATQQSRSLVEQLTEMQRAFGQFEVLGDEDFYKIYLERRGDFRTALNKLATLPLTEAGREQLDRLSKEEDEFYGKLHERSAQPSNVTSESVLRSWSNLSARARTVLAESGKLIERQASLTTATADGVQRSLLLQAAAVIPAAIVLAGLFVVLITRPMRQVGWAIRRLGAQEFSAPIEVRGPRDVEELGAQLDWLRRRIQELEREKVTFLRHISHELKTPLTTIRQCAELLRENLDDAGSIEEEMSKILCSNSIRLQKLIEDLLQFAKTQVPTARLSAMESVDLRELVDSTLAGHALEIKTKRVRLEKTLSEARIRGDQNWLRIIVDNLLTNAIKYTPTGGTIGIELSVRDEHAVLEVRDTGPGVPDEEREKIFEPFYQGQAEYQSPVKGTGLGLAIVKEYVEAHDGTVEVLGSTQGARFRVELPVSGPQAS
jgi:two-component system sensor histidine kinase GlrK